MPTKGSYQVVLFNDENGEKIADINPNSINMSIEYDYITDYVKDKNGNKIYPYVCQWSKTITLELKPSISKNQIENILGIDKSNVLDKFDLQISIKIQNRIHKKMRINKKWAKRYGYHYIYVDMGKYNIKNNDKDEMIMVKKY